MTLTAKELASEVHDDIEELSHAAQILQLAMEPTAHLGELLNDREMAALRWQAKSVSTMISTVSERIELHRRAAPLR